MKIDIEPCPKCGTRHQRGDYVPYTDGTTRVGPYDIVCNCGITIHWSVPIFKITDSGYVLRILRDDETPHLPEKA